MASGGKNNRACGSRFELECVKDALAKGVKAKKRFMSGQLDGEGDIDLECADEELWDGEAKWRKLMPKWFVECLGVRKFVVMKQSRGEKLVIIRWDDFIRLLLRRGQ
jgi:hypothetical protein